MLFGLAPWIVCWVLVGYVAAPVVSAAAVAALPIGVLPGKPGCAPEAGAMFAGTSLVAYAGTAIGALYYLVQDHRNRDIGPGSDAYRVTAGGTGTPLTGAEPRTSPPANCKVRDIRRGPRARRGFAARLLSLRYARRAGWAVTAVTVLATAAACSSGLAPPHSMPPAHAALSTKAGTALVISPGRMLAATSGVTPVSFGKPAHGSIAYGANGAMIYTPDAGFTGTDELPVTVSDTVRLYVENRPPLAIIGGVAIQSVSHGSAIAAVPGAAGEIYGLTDRGPAVDGRTAGEKVFPLPDFHPQIVRLKLADGTASVERTVTLCGTDGAPLVGLAAPRSGTGESLVDLNGTPLAPSDHGLDPEGLVAMPDGGFWVSDEYGPSIVHFDANGRELERLSASDGSLPNELSLRAPDRGMAGLTITPDGRTLVGIMYSALQTPAGPSASVPVTRIVTVDLADRANLHEYLYPLADPQRTKVGVSDITAIGATTFLVDERDDAPGPQGNKKIYVTDIAGATDVGPHATVPGSVYRPDAGGLLIDGTPIETFVGVSTDASATDKLKAAGVAVATKAPKLNLGAVLRTLSPHGDFFGHEKVEGLVTPDAGKTLIIANDGDFGLAGLAPGSHTPPLRLQPKKLRNGTQDSGEILSVDMAKVPVKMDEVRVPIVVG